MRWKRAWAVALAAVAVTWPACFLYQNGPSAWEFPGCLFHHLTGFVCPGCGMTRATYAALHGRLGEAIRFNPLGMVVFPVALLAMGLELAGWVRGAALPVRMGFGPCAAGWLIGVVLALGVLRNIPVWQFTLLAPP